MPTKLSCAHAHVKTKMAEIATFQLEKAVLPFIKPLLQWRARYHDLYQRFNDTLLKEC